MTRNREVCIREMTTAEIVENHFRGCFIAVPGLQETIHSWFMVKGESGRLGNHPALYAIGSGAKS